MLLNLHKKKWTDGLTLQRYDEHGKTNEATVKVCLFVMASSSKSDLTQSPPSCIFSTPFVALLILQGVVCRKCWI